MLDISGVYGEYYTSDAASSAKAEKLKSSISNTDRTSKEEELMDVCKQFEAYFMEQVMKQAYNAFLPNDSLTTGGDAASNQMMSYYKDELIKEYAKGMSDQSGDNSLANMLYQQMKRNYGIDAVDPDTLESVSAAAKSQEISDEEDK